MTLEQLESFKESLTDWSWVRVDEEPDVLITFELKLVSAFISMVGYRYASDTVTDIDKGMVSIMLGPICDRYGISLGHVFKHDDKEEEERQKVSCTICDNPKAPTHNCPYYLSAKGYDKKCNCCQSCTDECEDALIKSYGESAVEGVPDDEMCDKCKVSSCLTLPHPCHYKQVKDGDDTLCNCCFLCEDKCFELGLELTAKSYGTK